MITSKGKRTTRTRFSRVKRCRVCQKKDTVLDYKDTEFLMRFLTKRGRIASRRVSGLCTKHRRKVAEAVKRARFLSLLPYASGVDSSQGRYRREGRREMR